MLILIGIVIVLLIIYGFSGKNLFSGSVALFGAVFIGGGVGLALMGTGVALPLFGVLIVLFFLVKGIISR